MWKSLYISRFWFFAFAFGIVLIVMGYYLPILLYAGQFFMVTLFILTFLDGFLLFGTKKLVTAQRIVDMRLNLGDQTEIKINVENIGNQPLNITVFDEPPVEMQARDLKFRTYLKSKKQKNFNYSFKPTKRGQYQWKDLHVFVRSFIGLLERKTTIKSYHKAVVYPSVLQMKKFDFLIFNQQVRQIGIKKRRRLGHNNEFEQIKNYVQGDDIRAINWKATSRTSELMVNQYQEQRSQSIYAVIDKSRAMGHSFEGLTLLDYSINSTLVFANIALKKGDKFGLISFSHKMGTQLAPNLGKKQLNKILELLYAQKTEFKEANFSLLYQTLHTTIPSRSLLMLYTNFETELSMKRALPMLKRLNKRHVLVVVFFKNTEINEKLIKQTSTIRDVYFSALAEDVMNIKSRIALELKQHGIYSILTTPDKLSIDTINKYLELKAKGSI